MDLGLHDKTALALGAGGPPGGTIARTPAREGAKVASPRARCITGSVIRIDGGLIQSI